jgi:hypothetical protein
MPGIFPFGRPGHVQESDACLPSALSNVWEDIMRLSRSSAATAAIAAAFIAGPAVAGPEVTVVNTPAQPVPTTIQGTVNVTGAATVNGTIGIDSARNTVRVDADFSRPVYTINSDAVERLPQRTDFRDARTIGTETVSMLFLPVPIPGWMPVADLVSIQVAAPPGATVLGTVDNSYFANFHYQGIVGGRAVYVATIETRIGAGQLGGGVSPFPVAVFVDTSACAPSAVSDTSFINATARTHYVRVQ